MPCSWVPSMPARGAYCWAKAAVVWCWRAACSASYCSRAWRPTMRGSFLDRVHWARWRHEVQSLRAGSCWIPGSWMCRWRTTRLLSFSLPWSPYFSIALKMSYASRTTREHKTPESNKSVGKLEDGDQCQTRRRFCGLATRRKEGGELRVLVDGAEAISHLHINVAVWEGRTGHPLGVFRDWIRRVGV